MIVNTKKKILTLKPTLNQPLYLQGNPHSYGLLKVVRKFIKTHGRRGIMEAGNLYIMEFDFTYMGNDYQYQNKNVDT